MIYFILTLSMIIVVQPLYADSAIPGLWLGMFIGLAHILGRLDRESDSRTFERKIREE